MKMAAIIHTRQKQHAVIEILLCEKQTGEIFTSTCRNCMAMMLSTGAQLVTGVSIWQGGHDAAFESTCIGRQHSSRRDDIVEKVHMFMAGRRVVETVLSPNGQWRRKFVQNTGTVRLRVSCGN
jgi:hypothetical protein